MSEEQLGFDAEHSDAPISERAIAASAPPPPPDNSTLNAALMAAIKDMPVWITTDKKGAHNAKYATLKAILEVVRPILWKQGVRIRQGAERSFMLDEGGGVKGRLVPVFTDFIHSETGEFERCMVEMPVTKLDAPAMGSAIAYGKRYTLIAGLGLATDEAEDDGEATKVKSMNEAHTDSPELAAMTRDLMNFKDATKLAEWTDEGKTQQRYSSLSPAEQATLRARKAEKVRQLLASDDDAPKKPAKKAVE